MRRKQRSIVARLWSHVLVQLAFVALALLLVVVAVLLLVAKPYLDRERAIGLCKSNLCHIACWIGAYRAEHGRFPPAYLTDESGRPAHSWRVLIMGIDDPRWGGYDFLLPWDSPENLELLDDSYAGFFVGPADPDWTRRSTSYVAVIGDNTFWPGEQGRWITTKDPRIGEKILVIEIPNSDIRWTEPRDITLEEALRLFSAKEGGLRDSGHPGGLHYLTVNGQIKQFSSIKSVEEFATLLQLDPSEEGPQGGPRLPRAAGVGAQCDLAILNGNHASSGGDESPYEYHPPRHRYVRVAEAAGSAGRGWDGPVEGMMVNEVQHSRKPKRRWYQFSLRTLLLVTLFLGVVSGWIGHRLQRARRNREALDELYRVASAVEKAGGWSHFEYAEEPDWLGRLFGDPGVSYVRIVGAGNRLKFDDVALEDLLRVAAREGLSLESLDLAGTQVTDAGLEHLKGLSDLRDLNLAGTRVTDAGLEHLKGVPGLERLDLGGTQVTDAGLPHLGGVTRLQSVWLGGTRVRREAVVEFRSQHRRPRLLLGPPPTRWGLWHPEANHDTSCSTPWFSRKPYEVPPRALPTQSRTCSGIQS